MFNREAIRHYWGGGEPSRDLRWMIPLLAIASGLYGAAVSVRTGLYRLNILRAKTLPIPVISIGNLSVGGTGKTPLAIAIGDLLLTEGYRVSVLSRGYGGVEPEEPLVVSDGESIRESDPAVVGDEPLMIAARLPQASVVVSPDRYASGMLAAEHLGADVAILDDGYQHLRLARNLNILAVKGEDTFGNGHILPWGPLRESVRAARRADLVACIGDGPLPPEIPPDPPRIRFNLKVEGIHELTTRGLSKNPVAIEKERVLCVAGIASPESFETTVTTLGAEVAGLRSFPDHHPYTLKDLLSILVEAEAEGASWVVTTEKDAVKLKKYISEVGPSLQGQCKRIGVVRIGLDYEREKVLGAIRQRLRLPLPSAGE